MPLLEWSGCSGAGPSHKAARRLPPQTQQRYPPQRLRDHRAVDLRAADQTVAKDDRDLDHFEAMLDRAIGDLDLEGIAARLDCIEVQRFKHLATKALEAGGQIVDPQAEDEPSVGTAAAADRPPHHAPVLDATPSDVT